MEFVSANCFDLKLYYAYVMQTHLSPEIEKFYLGLVRYPNMDSFHLGFNKIYT